MAMINCPKCSFFQPEDQFCASCGVNMQKWTAPKIPLWKKVIGNWMFQLAILFVIIVGVILSDSFSAKNDKQTVAEAPRIRRKSMPPPEERERLQPTKAQTDSSFKAQPSAVRKRSNNDKAVPLGSMKVAKKIQKALVFENTISARVYFVPKNNIASILNSSTRLDDNAGTLHQKSFENYRKKKKGWVRLTSKSVDFNLNEPSSLFFGARHQESGRNLGFYFQINVFDANSETTTFAIRVWSELKPGEENGDVFTYEATMKRKHSFVVAQFAPKLTYSEDEATFLEGVQELRPLNSARFIEDFNDILVVLEIGKIR